MSAPAKVPTGPGAGGGEVLRICVWCVLAVVVEVGLFASYRGHDAAFHWFTHFFVGASVALLAMSAVAARTRRAVRLPLVWLLVGHLVAMIPDFLFSAGIAHRRWMDVFLGHISSHFVPGRNLTWYLMFGVALAVHLLTLDRLRADGDGRSPTPRSCFSVGRRRSVIQRGMGTR